jgi:hypothetical protein
MPQSKKTAAPVAKAKKATKVKEASSAQCFWVNHGPVCKTTAELQTAIKNMSDTQYAYHTKRGGNDFAKWMRDVMKHPLCATKLEKVRTKAGAVKVFDSCND